MNSYIKIDLLTIIFIIILSYIFTVSANKNINIQLLFIVFGLCIMIAHKISYKILSKKELFTDTSDLSTVIDSLNSFVNNTSNSVNNSSLSTGNQTDIVTLNTNLESLKSSLDSINSLINNSGSSTNSSTLADINSTDRMTLESQNALQSYQIKFLQNQIQKTTDLINAKQMQDNMAKYKPIKVYSSCAIDKTNTNKGNSENMGNLLMTSDNVTTPTNSQLLNTISQNNNSNFLNNILDMLNKANNKTITI